MPSALEVAASAVKRSVDGGQSVDLSVRYVARTSKLKRHEVADAYFASLIPSKKERKESRKTGRKIKAIKRVTCGHCSAKMLAAEQTIWIADPKRPKRDLRVHKECEQFRCQVDIDTAHISVIAKFMKRRHV